MSRSPILEARQLTKRYGSGSEPLTVLRDVSFSLHPGATCAIVGPSGSGKTTLLSLCAGLDQPSAGSVTLDGRNLQELTEEERAQMRGSVIGFVFQNFQLLPTLTAIENVMVPVELRGGKGAREQAAQILGKVGLGDRLQHYPAQLSGGEQQRVAIARAFVHRPKILFADEPTGNLDTETGHRIIELLFELNAALGTTLVLVTHDVELAERSDRVLRLRGGVLAGDQLREAAPQTDEPPIR